MEETFRQSRKPLDHTPKPKQGVSVSGQMPPVLQEAIRRHKDQLTTGSDDRDDVPPPPTASTTNLNPAPIAQPSPEMPAGPRLAFTGNPKLDELMASIKEQVYKFETITLPSKGKFYDGQAAPNNGVLHVRCMTGEEESILGTPRYIKKGEAINMIFKNCCRETINPDQLLSVDRTYLLIFLRGISYGTSYDVELKCSECYNRFNTTIDLDSLLVNYCPDNFSSDNLSDVLPSSKFKFSYRLATGKDENTITAYREKRIRQFGDDATDDSWLYRASMLINDIEGMDDRIGIHTLVSRLPISDVAYIRSCISDPPFGVETKIQVLCPMCNEGFTVDMPLETSFFFPKPRKVKGTRV